MQTIGRRLKYKRESLGMTLTDIENKIKIQRKYIEMIERDEFDKLPNPDYAIGFIEKFARSVNLNPETLLNDHRHELPHMQSSALAARKQLINDTEPAPKSDQLIRPIIIGLLAVVLAATLLWLVCAKLLFTDRNHSWTAADINESRNVKVDKSVETAEVAKKTTKAIPSVKKTVNVKYKSFDGSALSYEATLQEAMTLKVSSKSATWLQVYDNNNKRYAYQAVKSKTMKIDKKAESVTMISGNSTDMEIYVNGQKIEVPKTAENLITRTYQFNIKQEK